MKPTQIIARVLAVLTFSIITYAFWRIGRWEAMAAMGATLVFIALVFFIVWFW